VQTVTPRTHELVRSQAVDRLSSRLFLQEGRDNPLRFRPSAARRQVVEDESVKLFRHGTIEEANIAFLVVRE
jgi:hypothetical protein